LVTPFQHHREVPKLNSPKTHKRVT
jgi:hypothetical protein